MTTIDFELRPSYAPSQNPDAINVHTNNGPIYISTQIESVTNACVPGERCAYIDLNPAVYVCEKGFTSNNCSTASNTDNIYINRNEISLHCYDMPDNKVVCAWNKEAAHVALNKLHERLRNDERASVFSLLYGVRRGNNDNSPSPL